MLQSKLRLFMRYEAAFMNMHLLRLHNQIVAGAKAE